MLLIYVSGVRMNKQIRQTATEKNTDMRLFSIKLACFKAVMYIGLLIYIWVENG